MYRTYLTLFSLGFFLPPIIAITLEDFHSPCPDVLRYLDYNSIDRRWDGELTILSETDLNGIRILLTFDTPPQYFGISYGSVLPIDEKTYSVVKLDEKLKARVSKKLQFYVVHAVSKLPPKLVLIQLNSKQVCPKVTPSSSSKTYVFEKTYVKSSYSSKSPSSASASSQNYNLNGFDFKVTYPNNSIEAECYDVLVYEDKHKGILTILSKTNTTDRSKGVWMRLIFDEPVQLSSSYGDVTKIDDRTYGIQNFDDQLIGNEPKRIPFVLQYDDSKPAPNLLSFHHAGTQVCNAYFLQNSAADQEDTSFSSDFPDLLKGGIFSSKIKSISSEFPDLLGDDFFKGGIKSFFNRDSNPSENGFFNGGIKSLFSQVSDSSTDKDLKDENESVIISPDPDSSKDELLKDENESIIISPDPDSSEDGFSKGENKPFSSQVLDSSKDVFFTITTKPSGDDIACGTVAIRAQPLITFGDKTYEGEFPWHVALYYLKGIDLQYTCGASLISKRFVITAAHCATKPLTNTSLIAENFIAYLGKHYLNINSNETVQDMQISEIIVHPQYNGKTFSNDIALLKLALPAEYNNYVRPVCLWQDSISLSEILNKPGNVVGWGFDQTGNISEQLSQSFMPVVALETCLFSFKEFYAQFVTSSNYCAGYNNGSSVCNGDSGGGMVFPKSTSNPKYPIWQLRGLVSLSARLQDNSFRCDTSNYVLFTDIAKFLDWIQNIIK